MREFIKVLTVGIMMLFLQVQAESYKVLVLPDNIVTDTASVDAYIYNSTAEFFAEDIINILNMTDNISCPIVSDSRQLYTKDAGTRIMTQNLTTKFRTSYHTDYSTLRKVAKKSGARYVLMLTSTIDAENYILRRTFWDFLNVPGATVVDPAYKISTYAVLIDTYKNVKLWSDTYYKTISVCEHRIITRGPSPQTQQLEKIKDYSRQICPEIAQEVQAKILPYDVYQNESVKIKSDVGTWDNVFTKKYRHYKKGAKSCKHKLFDKKREEQADAEDSVKLDVEAKPVQNAKSDVTETKTNILNINTKQKTQNTILNQEKKQTNDNKQIKNINYYESFDFDIKKQKKNTLKQENEEKRPDLRDYYN